MVKLLSMITIHNYMYIDDYDLKIDVGDSRYMY